jgi:F0F1-type ATP synthase assembly protein I
MKKLTEAKQVSLLIIAWECAFTIFITPVIIIAGGFFIDLQFKSNPLFLIIGILGGFLVLILEIPQLLKKLNNDRNNPEK